MTTIPTVRPAQLVAGDTWRWTRDLADYPAGTWTLTYYFENKDKVISAAAAASGTTHSISVAGATTAGYPPGRYRVYARVTDGTIIETVPSETGWLDVLPDYAAAGVMDHRSWAQRTLDALRAAYEGRADTDQLSTSINGRAISRMSKRELREEIEALERRVQREIDAEAINQGQPAKNRLLVRG